MKKTSELNLPRFPVFLPCHPGMCSAFCPASASLHPQRCPLLTSLGKQPDQDSRPTLVRLELWVWLGLGIRARFCIFQQGGYWWRFLQSLMLSLFWIAKPSLRVDGPPTPGLWLSVMEGGSFDPGLCLFSKLRVGLPFFFSLELWTG